MHLFCVPLTSDVCDSTFLHGNSNMELKSDSPFYVGHVPSRIPRDPFGPVFLFMLPDGPERHLISRPLSIMWVTEGKCDCISAPVGKRTGLGCD